MQHADVNLDEPRTVRKDHRRLVYRRDAHRIGPVRTLRSITGRGQQPA